MIRYLIEQVECLLELICVYKRLLRLIRVHIFAGSLTWYPHCLLFVTDLVQLRDVFLLLQPFLQLGLLEHLIYLQHVRQSKVWVDICLGNQRVQGLEQDVIVLP